MVIVLPLVVAAEIELPDIVTSRMFPAFTDETKSEYASSVETLLEFPFWNKLKSNKTTRIIVIHKKKFLVNVFKIKP